ncbi:phosphoenolpyruvate carboxykinase (ATP) [Candidatus Peregrinibacteria bacterium]|jgi:phosphoenolpyruvate carboxykinase (ATP)|nr:phosphoenolpyruvate carboxykinase (ATP) [Candidatus Peregrinibacteria bacterium]MBT7703735.1 phosphoenolpyruvate carboxykinase (ATP) [Candidatus Peregrinibacteria bacterium]
MSCKINKNLSVEELVAAAIARDEVKKSKSGALASTTGTYTGRSPHDKFIVDTEDVHNEVSWGDINVAITEENYEKLEKLMRDYLDERDEVFVFEGKVGADSNCSLKVRVNCEYAYQALFCRHMFVNVLNEELENFETEFTMLAAPGCKISKPSEYGLNSEAFIVVNMKKKLVLIGGSKYAGEIKKGMFSVANHLFPAKGVLPMHCSANMGADGRTAVFFGLSGTGKTTLSADPKRALIGDDEHGWGKEGIFNFEGGSYAKCLHLTREKEPLIYDAIRYGTILENVTMNDNGELDFEDDSLTQNGRAAYPLSYIPGHVESGCGGHPSAIVFLTADAFGVLPPISRLSKEQAMYHFVAGYTSKLAGTERGIVEPQAVFSSFFGKPFMPLKPMVYAELLGAKLEQFGTPVYLINTGWSGGSFGVGERINLPYSRAMVTAALNGDLDEALYATHPIFNLDYPTSCPNVPDEVLNPRNTWKDKDAYDKKAQELADLFVQNCDKFINMPAAVRKAGPLGAC